MFVSQKKIQNIYTSSIPSKHSLLLRKQKSIFATKSPFICHCPFLNLFKTSIFKEMLGNPAAIAQVLNGELSMLCFLYNSVSCLMLRYFYRLYTCMYYVIHNLSWLIMSNICIIQSFSCFLFVCH